MNIPFLEKNSEFPSMIVYLYSNKIPQSVEILKSLKPEIINFFRIINIDDPKIINIIKMSKKVKLKNIPSVFVIYNTFIDEIDINQLVYNLNIFINKQTKSFDVIDEDVIDAPPPPKIKKVNQPIKTEQVRNKINTLGGLSSMQPRPTKGVGHKGMAMSSLNDSTLNNDDSEPDNLPDNPLLDDNLKIPRNLNNEQKKELINNAMRQAEKERDEMLERDKAKQEGLSVSKQPKDLLNFDIIDDDFDFNDTPNENPQDINVDDYRT